MPKPNLAENEETQDFAFLGREFMTWLLWRVDRGEGNFGEKDDACVFAFGGRVRMAGLGDVTDAVLKGRTPAMAIEARSGVGAGRTLREAELKIAMGEREFRFTLVADTLDLKSVKLPALLEEQEDDRLLERITLLEELDGLIKNAFSEFIRERTRPVWQRTVIPAMRTWLVESLAVGHS